MYFVFTNVNNKSGYSSYELVFIVSNKIQDGAATNFRALNYGIGLS